MQAIPGVHERILGEVVRGIGIPREPPQEIPHVRLVPAHELPESTRVDLRHGTRDEILVVDGGIPGLRFRFYRSFPLTQCMMRYAIPMASGNEAIAIKGRTASSSSRIRPNTATAMPTATQISARRRSV